jgi:transcriptional regulator with XRE-family HTH domain
MRRKAGLRAAREMLGITQAELARRVGVDQSLISRIERGEVKPWPKIRREAATALGFDEDLLFPAPESRQ